ncbi:MAG: c-type cytochrome [Dehalococcoidia bacterium]|nr:c-type cytochrome [Dehalococcoidia bacterium]
MFKNLFLKVIIPGVLSILGLGFLTGCVDIPIPANAATPAPEVLRGQQVFINRGCFQSCHSLGALATKGNRHPLPDQPGPMPPDLTMTARRSDDWLLAYLISPQSILHYSPMTSYAHIPDDEIKDLIAYLKSINTSPVQTNIPLTDPSVIPPILADITTYRAGSAVYGIYCQGCHGQVGNGKGPVGHLLLPEPRDFTDAAWLSKQTNTYLYSIVSFGKPRTAMPAYNDILTLEERSQVLNYIGYFADPILKQRMELPALKGNQ